ncbi:MAG: phosphoenolpyruvate synthase [Bacteroidales bacterium]|nr:phosphoenolpyruvate synthase [Bacteroidales bacterium]
MALHPLKLNLKKYYFDDTSFINLMKKRIYHVLLISSAYDAFILEDDGRVDEQIFNEYVSLNLRYPPQFIITDSEEEAFKILEEIHIDLIITMRSAAEANTFEIAGRLKSKYPDTPIVILTPFSREATIKVDNEDLSAIDYIFSWLGNPDILLAIIKLIEDRMNVEQDVSEVGVQTIILVEDSIRFYSSYLPNIYKIIFKQSKAFMTEGLNEHQQMLRMRGRPKILLATTYEEAISLYETYKKNLLGIITDVSYIRNGVMDKEAGIRLCKKVKADDPYMPLLLQSSEAENEKIAKKIEVGFINKTSKTLSIELRKFIIDFFAFGDFIFLDPDTMQEINRAPDLKSLQMKMFEIPDDSLLYHITRNHFSKWLRARALFPLADLFRDLRMGDFDNDLFAVRRFVFDAMANFRISKARGIIAEFSKERFDDYLSFTRIGDGSIGGKARGLAFIDNLIKKYHILDKYDDVIVTIPKTVVLCTDIFDEFMEENNLYKIALSDLSDEDILQHFVKARLPFRIHEDLYTLISYVRKPLAIRSSSLLEDSHYQPFAGIYSTYMIPYIENDERLMNQILSDAIKCVYASAFFKNSKAYMAATSNLIDEEKMAIVIQTVCGQNYNGKYYPTISGVARSINFYPIEPEKPEDGIVNLALGLGKHIVDGGMTLRFSPKYSSKILQLSTPEMALKETQKVFYALDQLSGGFTPNTDDNYNIIKYKIKEAEKDLPFKHVASTYDFENNLVRDGIHYKGKKLITFSNILNHNVFPLAEIIGMALEIGQKEMNKPVEIEFAVDMGVSKDEPIIFNLLQIRPIVDIKETIDENLEDIPVDETIIYSNSALGNGVINDICDLVYVKPETFSADRNPEIARKIGEINEQFIRENKNYILIGPGRWGSLDPWLGIPVKWPQISSARVIIESGLENYRIDPSQGTHFFQNLTSFRVGYFTINPYINDGFYDLGYLSSFSPYYEDENIRHIRFEKPLTVMIDGQKNIGVIMK